MKVVPPALWLAQHSDRNVADRRTKRSTQKQAHGKTRPLQCMQQVDLIYVHAAAAADACLSGTQPLHHECQALPCLSKPPK